MSVGKQQTKWWGRRVWLFKTVLVFNILVGGGLGLSGEMGLVGCGYWMGVIRLDRIWYWILFRVHIG